MTNAVNASCMTFNPDAGASPFDTRERNVRDEPTERAFQDFLAQFGAKLKPGENMEAVRALFEAVYAAKY